MEDEQKIHEAQFMQLIISLQSSAWMMLGKTMNPITGKIEKNLDAAKSTIDTLLMLKAKTKGNLSKTEDDFLSNMIQQLQLNYVEESKSEEKAEEKSKTKEKNSKEESKKDEEKGNKKINDKVKEEKKKEDKSNSKSKNTKQGGEKND